MRPIVRVGVALFALLSASVIQAQTAPGAQGHWEGTIDVPGQQLAISVDLTKKADEVWSGTISIPAQNVTALPLSDIAVKGEAVSFAMKGVPGDPRFNGKLSGEPRTLSGQFTQAGMGMAFTLAWKGEPKIEAPPKSTKVSSDIEGSWEGTLSVGAAQLRLVVKLANDGEAARGTLVSLDQGGAEIPITQITQSGSALTLVIGPINGRYEGALKDAQLAGTWTQGPQSFPLTLKRQAK
jgi:uncharacterized protein